MIKYLPILAGLIISNGALALDVADCEKIKSSKIRSECFSALVSGGKNNNTPPAKQDEDSDIKKAKQELESTLKDPLSIQYRNITKNQQGSVCGEYNAKNSNGGYVGFKYFMYENGALVNNRMNEMEAQISQLESMKPSMIRTIGYARASGEIAKLDHTIANARAAIAETNQRMAECRPLTN